MAKQVSKNGKELFGARLTIIEARLGELGVLSYANNKAPAAETLSPEARRTLLAYQVLRATHPDAYRSEITRQQQEHWRDQPVLE